MTALKFGPGRWAVGLIALAIGTAAALPAAAQGDACPKLASSVKANWDNNLIGLATALRTIDRANQNIAAFATVAGDVTAARSDCTRLLGDKAGKGSIWAYQCVGDSAYMLARYGTGQSAQQRDADYSAAYCAYSAELALAKGNGQREVERRAAALEGQGRVLQGKSEFGGANSSRYLFDAIAAFTSAANTQPTHQRYLLLARAQVAAGNGKAASGTFDRLQGLAPDPANFPDAVRAAALREQARIQQGDPASFTVATTRELWNRARGIDHSAESHFGYAKTFFDANDVNTAKSAFTEASNAPNQSGGTINYANEAAYYIAVIDARTASTQAQWGQVLASAERAGPGDVRYRRLACAAYIGRGGDALVKDSLNYRDGATGPCTSDDAAEGQLLRGMYMLRMAQYLPLTCAKSTNPDCPAPYDYKGRLSDKLNGARTAFQRGKGMATNEAVFNWLEQPGATEPKLKEALDFGDTLGASLLQIDGCRASPTGVASAMQVFRQLDLMGCAPSAK